jgi:hypothetical protein
LAIINKWASNVLLKRSQLILSFTVPKAKTEMGKIHYTIKSIWTHACRISQIYCFCFVEVEVRSFMVKKMAVPQDVSGSLIRENGLVVMAGTELVEWYQIHVFDAIPFTPF